MVRTSSKMSARSNFIPRRGRSAREHQTASWAGALLKHLLAVTSPLSEDSLEQLTMRGVKALMIARHILTWLWLFLWVAASPVAHARVVCAAESLAPCICGETGENQPVHDFVSHFHPFRVSRRIEFDSSSTDMLDGIWSAQSGFLRPENFSSPRGGSEVSSDLACGWQFVWRTALSPRAPSSLA